MKKVVFILIALIGIGFYSYSYAQGGTKPSHSPIPELITASPTSEADTKLGNPIRLQIKKLDIDTQIEYVGMDSKGNMDVPKDDFQVAWFEPGFKPGTSGNAVIAGHFDRKSGAPAVFYKLDTLTKNDQVTVVTENGKTYTFVVDDVAKYPVDDFPLVTVFGNSDTPKLNLITCEGNYDTSRRTYTHRTVVYTSLR